MARRIEDEFGHVQQLILIGKERGYLLCDEINESLPAEVNSSQEIDDLLSVLERQGIEIYEDPATASAARAAANAAESPETERREELATEAFDLSLGVDTKSQDPVRIYLREMGSVPLLTNVGDVGHRNGRDSESNADARRQRSAGVLFPAAAPSVGRHRSHRIDALVSEPHGGVGNRMPGRPSRHDSRSGATEAET